MGKRTVADLLSVHILLKDIHIERYGILALKSVLHPYGIPRSRRATLE